MTDPRTTPWPAPSTTVVTGATGWLGTALVHRLLADPGRRHLRLLVPGALDATALEQRLHGSQGSSRVEVVVGDISRRATAERLLDGAGAQTDVIHTAGIIHPRRCREFVEVNAQGTRHVVDVARRAGVRRLVHVSSNSPFGTNPDVDDTFRDNEPYHPYLGYGRSKMLAELAVLEAVERGLDAVIVRPPWFYGPHQPPRQTTFFRLVRTGRFPVIGDGGQRRSMVYIDHLVDGVLAAELVPDATGRGYWIADREAYTVAHIVDTVGRALEAEGLECASRRTSVPVLASRVAERADRLLQSVGLYQQQVHVLGEMGHHIACDISIAERDLGYRPTVSLYEGMRASIRWCLDQGIEL
ncbi:MAG: NAD-dependent epimerase/dehydratase family protein, partial [Ilumatobacteraceae bacterium]